MLVLALVALVAAVVFLAAGGAFDSTLAQTSPFGGARPAAPPAQVGGVVGWMLAKQAEFYRAMSGLIRAAKVDGTAVWGLLGLSFLYGVFHAAGPGHGKAVISSYLLANEETWRRGVTLSFASALLQAFVAVALVGVAAVALNATAKTMNDAVRVIEVVSYALIALLGARLTWVKGRGFIRALRDWRSGQAARGAPNHAHGHAARDHTAHVHAHHSHEPVHHEHAHPEHEHYEHAHHEHEHAHHAHAHHDHAHMTAAHAHRNDVSVHHDHAPADHSHDHRHDHDHGHDDHAHDHGDHCGHSHGPDPQELAGRGGWRRGLSAIVAVGLRPCSGAILVLVFALAQGLFWAGVASTFVMGLGTAITVAAIATFAVGAKSVAKRMAAHRAGGGVLAVRGIEAAAALAVLVFGVALLAGYMATERMI